MRPLLERHTAPFGLGEVEKLRKDFLLLMKQIDKPKDYAEAINLAEAFRRWNLHYEETVYTGLVKNLWDIVGKKIGGDYSDQYTRDRVKKEVEYWDKLIREACWGLVIEMKLPMDRSDDYWTPEMRFAKFELERSKWDGRVRRAAQKAWPALKKFVDWVGDSNISRVSLYPQDHTTIEGFRVTVRGDPGEGFTAKSFETFKDALRVYRARAQRVWPWLVKWTPRFEMNFEIELDVGGRYHHDHIEIQPTGMLDGVARGVWVIAHEVGHHVYRVFLSEAQKVTWRQVVRGGVIEIPLDDVLAAFDQANATDVMDLRKARGEDDLLVLRLDAYLHGWGLDAHRQELWQRSDFEALKTAGKSVLAVRADPISGYAEKNDEEAFCEALGVLVAHGPRRLPAPIRGALRSILPEVRLESIRDRVGSFLG